MWHCRKCHKATDEFSSALIQSPFMRRRQVISSLLSAGLLLASSQAQTGDWQAVQDIPPGSEISVKTESGSARCVFENATDTELRCERRLGTSLRSVTFDRQAIRRVVRLEHPGANAALGAAIGTGIGGAVGVAVTKDSKDAETRVYAPLLLGILGGIVSGVIMKVFSPVYRRVVYRQ
jgi:hypothetical protein